METASFKKNDQPLVDERGFTLIEQIIVLAILGFLIAGTASVLPQILAMQKNSGRLATLNVLRSKVISTLRNSQAFQETLTDGANAGAFVCWTSTPSDCSAIVAPVAFTPVQSDGSRMFGSYNPRGNPGHGFDFDGNFCTGYDAATPNPQCPIRLDLTWLPICPEVATGLPCSRPSLQVQLTFSLSMPEELNFRVDLNQLNSTVLISGDSKIGHAENCPQYEVVTGVSHRGNLECEHSETIWGKEPL